jgi:hypothetical protein
MSANKVTKFRTPDGWTVEPVSLSMVASPTRWGDPRHGDGRYLKATSPELNMVFYAGSASKDSDKHDVEAFSELAAEGLFDLADLEEVIVFEVPASLADKVRELLGEAA